MAISQTRGRIIVAGLMLSAAAALSACDETGTFSLAGAGGGAEPGTTRTIERDVEAPEVYQSTDQGLWDGRPSLGGVWVAEPGVTDPERVIIRNEENDAFVIGALFRRERETPGPAFQVSSDAAEALGMLAGQPARLNVTALRRQEVAPDPEPAASPVEGGEISTETLDGGPETSAAEVQAATEAASTAAATSTPQAPATSPLAKPFTQIGIFSVEANARNTATSLRNAGLTPQVLESRSRGKTFYRVIVGPSQSSAERARVLDTVKGLGFTDAYFVSR